MFYIIQIFILGLIILNIRLNKKNKSDASSTYFYVCLLVASLVSNIVLSFIALPTSEVTLRALDDKHKDSESFEVKILNLEIDGKELSEFDLNEGKWMRNEEAYYMWRDSDDTRQPNGLTEEIKFNIPYGSNRNIVFTSDEYSGLVEIDDGTQIQVIDLYNQESVTKKVEITANTKSQMNKFMLKRIVTWFVIGLYIYITIGIYIYSVVTFLYRTAIKKPKTRDYIILSVILFTQVMIMIYFGSEKLGFHVDEVWTMEISNKSFDIGRDFGIHSNEENFNVWHNSDFFKNVLTVTEEQRFNFIEPYTITSTDVHPPLYYMMIRFVSSLFPNTFSKWIGIVPNIIFFVIGNIILYKISDIIFKGRYIKWLPVIFWGFSIGAISSVIFLRMYSLLTLIVLLFVYNYLKCVYNQEIKAKSMMIMFIITYLGCMTQYYFLIFAFFFTAYECLKRLFLKDYKNMFLFGFSVLGGVIMLAITFPYAIEHLFFEGRGAEAITNFKEISFMGMYVNLFLYIRIIERQILGVEKSGIAFILLSFSILICYINKVDKYLNKDKGLKVKFRNHILTSNLTPILTSSIIYIILIVWIAPYQEERYIVCTFPFICLFFIYFFEKTIKLSNFKNQKLILFSIVFFIIINGGLSTEPYYLYQEYDNNDYYYAEENSDIPMIFIERNSIWDLVISYPLFTIYDQVFITKYSDIENITNIVNEDMDKLILFLYDDLQTQHIVETSDSLQFYSTTIGPDEIADEIKNLLGYQTIEKLHSFDRVFYRLSN